MKYFILSISFLMNSMAIAGESKYSFNESPSDYLFKDRGKRVDDDFYDYRTIELGIDLSSGLDCGKLDLKGTLKSSISKILDKDMYGNALEGIVKGAPMLTICYFSPTWCSLAKHFRMNAQNMSQLRLDQCALMDKYTDSRVDDYYKERQDCLHKELKNTDGNHEEAISRCGGSGLFQKDIANWAGGKFGGKVKSNKLIESSAKWAGFTGPKSKRAIDLVKAFVGDTAIAQGNISVEYGPRKMALSPKLFLTEIKNNTYKKLCGDALGKVRTNGNPYEVFSGIADKELKEIESSGEQLVDKQSLYYLAMMPTGRRNTYCRKLSAAIAMSKFSNKVGESLQILTEIGNNPNLPPNRKRELLEKRRIFKESVDFTISLEKQENEPINLVLARINSEGSKVESNESRRVIHSNETEASFESLKNTFFDCADEVDCNYAGGN